MYTPPQTKSPLFIAILQGKPWRLLKIQTTKKELGLLKDHKKKAVNDLIRDRAHCLILSNKGYKVF